MLVLSMLVVDVSSESSDLLELETLLAIASKETMKTYCSDTDSIMRLLVIPIQFYDCSCICSGRSRLQQY